MPRTRLEPTYASIIEKPFPRESFNTSPTNTLTPMEIDTYQKKKNDKELLAIVDSFMKWRHFPKGSSHQVTLFSDHNNLAYF
jgi:hypothetical protein